MDSDGIPTRPVDTQVHFLSPAVRYYGEVSGQNSDHLGIFSKFK